VRAPDHLFGGFIKLSGRNARPNAFAQVGQNPGDDAAGFAHARELGRRLQVNHGSSLRMSNDVGRGLFLIGPWSSFARYRLISEKTSSIGFSP
jgi:hypothetical protein